MAEIEIGGIRYMTGRLNALEQFAIARRVGKVAAGMAQTWGIIEDMIVDLRRSKGVLALANGDGTVEVEDETPPLDAIAKAAKPLAEALGEMSDDDCNYILRLCLSRVTRFNGASWVPVMSSNGILVFEDIDMVVMLRLVWDIIEEKLRSFTAGLRQPNMAGGLESMSNSSL